jgi:hypothetical protein
MAATTTNDQIFERDIYEFLSNVERLATPSEAAPVPR